MKDSVQEVKEFLLSLRVMSIVSQLGQLSGIVLMICAFTVVSDIWPTLIGFFLGGILVIISWWWGRGYDSKIRNEEAKLKVLERERERDGN